ncbi:MAG: DNA mismatch repair endonuclease MutL [Bacteroidales bacterium]|nr:DNA mismatch repair endonuclease MutL [Bacteroidales bacterium]
MIKVLPSNIANLIAAGEVVGRPASVVKELMENSIDAGSATVSVSILDAGRTLIQVIDDGCGMSPEDAALCFERHATSKIAKAEDLEKILTYGFRGEALASIAAVAQVTLKTRREEDVTGVQIEAADSRILSSKPVAAPRGCNIAVANLFYNVPARRKFLKSDAAEMRHIEQEFLRVALSHCDKAFCLKHNGKDIYNIRPAAGLKQRINDLCGREMAEALVDIKNDTDIIKISGFIGSPLEARKTPGNQFFFINGRYFRSPFLHKAVCKPYDNLVREGYIPSYFIFLECDPTEVDVNIHPQKTEVKFTEEHIIFEILTASVKEALGRGAFGPGIDFESGEVLDFPVMGTPVGGDGPGSGGGGSYQGSGYSGGSGGYMRPPRMDYSPLFPQLGGEGEDAGDGRSTTPSDLYGPRLADDENPGSSVLVTSNGLILAPVREGLAVINIKKAQEAILYHKYFQFLSQERFISQRSLYPQQVALRRDIYSIVLENIDRISQLGFDIRDFGDNTIIVYAVPDGFPADEDALKEVMDNLAVSLDKELTGDSVQSYAATLAAAAAKKLNHNLNALQAQMIANETLILRATHGTDLATRCIAIISNEELEKRI